MPAPTVTNSNNRIQDMEGSVTGDTDIGSGPGPSTDNDFVYQNTQSWGRRIQTANINHGFFYTHGSTTDMTAGDDKVWMFKGLLTNNAQIGVGGIQARLGHTTSDYFTYLLNDDGSRGVPDHPAYPAKGGWIVIAIDGNATEWANLSVGTPDLSVADVFAATGYVGTTSNNENLFFDSIDLGDGLWINDGGGIFANGTFQDFADHDEGTIANRFGHVTTLEGVFFIFGKLVIGRNASSTVTSTGFVDSGKTLIFPGGFTDTGWNELEVDIGNSGSVVDWTNLVINGRGRVRKIDYFSSINDIDTGTDAIIVFGGHGFTTGDAVVYSKQGGSDTTGLTDATTYFVNSLTATNFSLFATLAGLFSGIGSPIALSLGATGERHSFTRTPDTRPTLTVTGTSGTFDCVGVTFDGFFDITPTTKPTFTSCIFNRVAQIDLGGGSSTATLDQCVMQDQTTDWGDPLILTSDTDDITDNNFTVTQNEAGQNSHKGHAIELDTGGTRELVGNSFSGYGPDGHTFNTETQVTGGATDTINSLVPDHPWVTRQAVYYHKEGGTESIGLTDDALYFVAAVDDATFTLHNTPQDAADSLRQIDLTPSGGGNGELHAFYSANAAVHNSSGSSITLNISGGVTSPTIRNSAGSSTTVNNNSVITLTGLVDPTEVRVYEAGTTTELHGQENVTTGTFEFSQPQLDDVDIRIFAVQYLPADILDFTIPTVNASLPIQQVFDRNYENPS